ncbi:protein spaetzle [Scaptodrosophila lebanonensis]|uniref:Protein spaetzle n=1 Tax=Drosophila lebanonensis TaxID=7225 RepID=A0A6J2T783_DROLE|nr:protein spaetzle [Scaptodrosophila lebanonensis]
MRSRAEAAQEGGVPAGTQQQQSEQQPQQQQQHQQQRPVNALAAKSLDDRIKDIFIISEGKGVTLFNTTSTDDASFMPIPTMLGDQPGPSFVGQAYTLTDQQAQQKEQQQEQIPIPMPNPQPNHYHQYQSLTNEQQTFKVQRSPDGKLSLVFNDPLVSLQQTAQQPQPNVQQPSKKPRQPISDTFVFPDQTAIHRPVTPAPLPVDTGSHQCADGFKESRSFCTKVKNYPDISNLKDVLSRNFAGFFSDEQQPVELGVRMDGSEQVLCKSRTKYLYPELGQSLDQSWHVIVNTEEFKQGIRVEECEDEGQPCNFLDSFYNNYQPVCKQHYILKHLATINNSTGGETTVRKSPIKIPSCCKCVIKTTIGGL